MRNIIFVENCDVLEHKEYGGEQFIIKLQSEKIAKNTQAGQFVHIKCSDELLMRRPISIMSVDKKTGILELLYKRLGQGTILLSQRKTGEKLNVMGPIGKAFELNKEKSLPILIGGGVGMPPMIALSQEIKNINKNSENKTFDPVVFLGSEVPFPFTPMLSNIGPKCDEASHTMPLLEEWGIAGRLASKQGFKGVYNGFAPQLADEYLKTLAKQELAKTELFACGPELMLEAVFDVAKKYDLPCQLSLEEFMACAVGGCAGCVVEIKTAEGKQMKRVCVDGPVFNGYDIYS